MDSFNCVVVNDIEYLDAMNVSLYLDTWAKGSTSLNISFIANITSEVLLNFSFLINSFGSIDIKKKNFLSNKGAHQHYADFIR